MPQPKGPQRVQAAGAAAAATSRPPTAPPKTDGDGGAAPASQARPRTATSEAGDGLSTYYSLAYQSLDGGPSLGNPNTIGAEELRQLMSNLTSLKGFADIFTANKEFQHTEKGFTFFADLLKPHDDDDGWVDLDEVTLVFLPKDSDITAKLAHIPSPQAAFLSWLVQYAQLVLSSAKARFASDADLMGQIEGFELVMAEVAELERQPAAG